MKRKDIISALYPSYVAQLLIGCAPYKIKKTRQGLKIQSRLIYDYLTRFILTVIVLFITYRYSLMNFQDFSNSGLIKFMTTSYFLVVSGIITINIVWTRIQHEPTKRLLEGIYDLDVVLRNTGIKLKYKNIRCSSIRFLSTGIISFTIYIIYLLTSQNLKNQFQAYTTYGLLYWGTLNYMVTVCSFVTLIKSITNMVQGLMKKIENELMYKSQLNQPKQLSKLMSIHHELYKLLKLASQVFSISILFSFAVSFLLITFQSYSIFCAVYNNSRYLKYSIASAVWIIVIIIEKMVVTFSCHKCMFCSKLLRQSLEKFIISHSHNKAVAKELNAFGLQLLHENFEVYAANMFLIDLPIFTSVCGTATTYIILLLQTDTRVDLNYSMKKVFGVF